MSKHFLPALLPGDESRRCCKHDIQDHGIRDRSDQQPGAEFPPAGPCLGNNNPHDRVIERIKYARRE